MTDIKIGTKDQSGNLGIKSCFHRPHQAFVTGALTLRISPYTIGTAQVHPLGTVQIMAGQLPGGLYQYIRPIAQPLHGCHIELALRVTAFGLILPELHNSQGTVRIPAQCSCSQLCFIIYGQTFTPFKTFRCHIDTVGMFIHITKGHIIILQLTVVVTILYLQTTVGQMIYGTMPEHADGISYAFQITGVYAHAVIHAAVAKAQSSAATADDSLVVGIVVVHIFVGQQSTHANLVTVAADIINIMLQAVTIAAGILAAVVFHIQDSAGTLALFDAHRKVTGAKFLAGAQHTYGFGAAHIRNGIKCRFQFARADDIPGL